MKTAEAQHWAVKLSCACDSTDSLVPLVLEIWQKGMTDAAEIVWPSSSSRPTNNAKDTIKFNAAMAILAARDARKE